MITALRATSRTISDSLQEQFERDPVLRGLFTPAEMTAARSGLSVWLYRVVRDDMTLNRPPERVTTTLTRRVPLPVRLHYLVTPITNSDEPDAPETEQAILGKVLQAFYDHPHLFVGGLGADLVHERHPVHAGHRPVDQVDLDRTELGQP